MRSGRKATFFLAQMAYFWSVLDDYGLRDFSFKGDKFTWVNKQKDDYFIQNKQEDKFKWINLQLCSHRTIGK